MTMIDLGFSAREHLGRKMRLNLIALGPSSETHTVPMLGFVTLSMKIKQPHHQRMMAISEMLIHSLY